MPPAEAYSDVHRLFMQMTLTHPAFSEQQAIARMRECFEAFNEQCQEDAWGDFLWQLNNKLDFLDMKISDVRHPISGSKFFVLANYSTDEIAKLATTFKPTELQAIRSILDKIMQSAAGSVSSTDILNDVPSSLMSKNDFQRLILDKLVDDMWLHEAQGQFSLGPRSLVELKTYFQDAYEDELPVCAVCKNFVGKRLVCECGTMYHPYCCKSSSRQCASCHHPIRSLYNSFIGVTDSNDDGASQSGSGSASSSQRRRRRRPEDA
ncbi:Non-structural maintenance of chromosomes element 1 [Sorochytrium milnesiophthora]